GRFTMSKSLKATLPAVLAVAATLVSAHGYAQPNNPPLNVNVTNTPLPVTGTVSGAVTITNQPNVFVTNSVANPVPTKDAYKRTPFTTQVKENSNFEVPVGVRLVLETISAGVQCQTGASGAFATATVVSSGVAVGRVTVPLTRGLDFDGTLSARIVLEPGERFVSESGIGCIGAVTLTRNFWLFGYLISVDSPSLAP